MILEYFRKFLSSLHISGECVDAILYTWLIILCLLVVSVLATKSVKTIPGGLQNFMEAIIGGIENMIVETMGEEGRPFFP